MEGRRRSIRQKCRLRGRIYFYDGRKSVPCGIRDISYEGARIELLERTGYGRPQNLRVGEGNGLVMRLFAHGFLRIPFPTALFGRLALRQ